MKWDLGVVAAATGGEPAGAAVVSGVVTDSREAGDGLLFVALRGEHQDGHDYRDDARRAGAALLVERGRLPAGAAGVEVDDTWAALRDLAVRRRGEIASPVAAITGSNGKTSTKDLLAAALGPGAHASPRSFNNEVGVPLTILGVPDAATAVVAEVGSRGRGHIALLAPALRPDVAVITNIGRAHLETFGDLANVLASKWELVEALGPAGVAVLPADDERLLARRDGGLLSFGEVAAADVAVSEVRLDEQGRATFRLGHHGERAEVRLAMAGRHQPRNAAAAAAAALALGVPFAEIVPRLEAAAGSAWRMEIHTGPVTIVNDAYNANPDSAAEALRTVAGMPGRHVAVLGKMHELGAGEAALHEEVGRLARDLGYAAVVVVGDDPGIATGAGSIARRVPDVEAGLQVLEGYLVPGDVVLVKASRAEGLEELAAGLQSTVGGAA
jgi:UDP-N-acetylmuramoyl-tripeptide--D-alanyl-D-alanine ligase